MVSWQKPFPAGQLRTEQSLRRRMAKPSDQRRRLNTMSAAISKARFVLTLASAMANAVGCHSEHRAYEVINGSVEVAKYKGRQAVHLVAPPDQRTTDMHLLAIAPDSNFTNGTIRVDVAGSPFDDKSEARGFIGVAFHVEPHG